MHYEKNADPIEVGAEEEELPGCCAINVLHTLEMIEGDMTEELVLEALKKGEYDGEYDAVIYTTALYQGTGGTDQKKIAAALPKAGFEAIKKFKRASGTEITIWLKVNAPQTKPRARRGREIAI